MRTHVLLGVALILAGLGAGAQDKPAEPAEKPAVARTARPTSRGPCPSEPRNARRRPEEAKTQVVKKEEVKREVDKVEAPPNLRAFDEGDTVRFEWRLPFGLSTYSQEKERAERSGAGRARARAEETRE